MKICAICGTENSDEAHNCRQCGFSLEAGESLKSTQFPTIEIPQISTDSLWADIPSIEMPTETSLEMPTVPPIPTPGGQVGPLEGDETSSVEAEADADAEVESDDELAREHIRRGFEALRAGLVKQAIWEFEQADNLADDDEVIRLARSQLRNLLSSSDTPLPQVIQPLVRTTIAHDTSGSTYTSPAPSSTWKDLVDIRPEVLANWKTILRFGVLVALAVAIFAGCSAIFCLGFVLTPGIAFMVGRWVAGQQKKDENMAPSGILPAIVLGAIVGLGGWLGHMVGYSSWYLSGSSSASANLEPVTSVLSCFSTGWYIPSGMALSVIGWRTGQRGEKS